MKRHLFFTVILFLVFLALPVTSLAAGSVTWTDYTTDNGGIQIVAVVTADASAATVPVSQLSNKNNRGIDFGKGFYLYSWDYYVGATPPTADTDLELLEHSASGYDILGGAGTDTIDASTPSSNGFRPHINGVESVRPVYGGLWLKITNNAENSATFTLVFNFIPIK